MSDGGQGTDTSEGEESDNLPDEFHAEFSSPEARAKEARDAALDALSRIPDDPDGQDKIEALDSEQQAVSTWAKHAAKAAEDGYPDANIEAAAKALSGETSTFTKKNLTGLVNDQRSRIRKATGGGGGSGPAPLDDWIDANLERVVRVETTDSTQDTVFRWDFSDGTVETATTKDGVTHFSWSHFRDEIYQGIGVNTAKPNRREAEEWRTWIAELIKSRGETKTNFGPRSAAIEKLQEYVRDSIAYGNKADAVERGGVYMDEDPHNGSPDELCVMNNDVKRICDDQEVEVRGLQNELDARGFTHDRVNGVSEGEYVDGAMIRYWVLKPDFATPAQFLEEGVAPAEAAAREDDDGDGSGQTPSAVGPAAGTDGAKLSSIGPDSSDGDDGEAADADAADADAVNTTEQEANTNEHTDPDAGGDSDE